jgi:carbon monoxide dehydrogenase subunit G
MHIKSNRQTIERPINEVYSFIEDFRNFEHLMPEQVKNYHASRDNCTFEISGMGEVALEMNERIEFSKVKSVSTGRTAVKFELIVNLDSENEVQCGASVELNAELSAMMAMIAKNPLEYFVNTLVSKLKELMEPA